MFALEERVDVARDPHDVFAFLTSPEHRPEWDRSVVSETLVSPAPVKVGSTVRTRMRVMGRDVAFEWRVTELDPPHAMGARSVSGTMPTTLRFAFEATDAGCRVIARIHAEPGGMLRMVEPVVAEAAPSTLAAGLARARILLETGP
ncbi:SRPBCC family protein [Agrococcus sp. SGAir0287]|uniref:SRPBCC family protein n=1 Tax=Agrococcus sp. SGAir0287 TaxID=2070347 RepID=UPI0015862F11|nr:SRPBCC family protein [Agrococcus sp. SGAir0287]